MKVTLILIIVIASAIIVGAVVGGYNIFKANFAAPEPSPTPPPATAPPPSAPPATSAAPPPTITQSFEQKLQDLQQTIQSVQSTGKSQEAKLVFTEAEVNSQAAVMITQMQSAPDAQFKATGIKIDLKPNNVMAADINAVAYGFNVPVKLKMQVGIASGKLNANITEISFGIIPVPQAIKDQIAAIIARSLDDLVVQMTQTGIGAGVAFEFKSISITENDMTIIVLVKPA